MDRAIGWSGKMCYSVPKKCGFEKKTHFRKKIVYGHPSSTRYDGWLHSREFQWKFVISKEKDMHQNERRL